MRAACGSGACGFWLAVRRFSGACGPGGCSAAPGGPGSTGLALSPVSRSDRPGTGPGPRAPAGSAHTPATSWCDHRLPRCHAATGAAGTHVRVRPTQAHRLTQPAHCAPGGVISPTGYGCLSGCTRLLRGGVAGTPPSAAQPLGCSQRCVARGRSGGQHQGCQPQATPGMKQQRAASLAGREAACPSCHTCGATAPPHTHTEVSLDSWHACWHAS